MNDTTTETTTTRTLATLERAVAELTTDAAWQRALATAARFHSYSFGNVLLITSQAPNATRVAGFKAWLALGRHVRRGEHGIAILAPMVFKVPDAKAETGERTVRRFKVAHVFDISQTDGADLSSTADWCQEIPAGDHDGRAVELYGRMAALLRSDGWTVRDVETIPEMPSARGVTVHDEKRVDVLTAMSAVQRAKTLAHEMAHVSAGERHGMLYRDGQRDRAEREAESAAFVLLGALGLECPEYSVGYVAGWAAGKADLVRESGKVALDLANGMLARLQAPAELAEAA